MRKIIQQERMIELALEGHRYWDLRRWKLADEYFSKPIQGWDIFKSDVESFYEVENIYEMCSFLMENGITLNRPPRDGRMAFVRSPDNISVELLQAGGALETKEPWTSMENIGHW